GSLRVEALRGLYLAALGYLLLALPWFDFGLRRRVDLPFPLRLRELRSEEGGLDGILPAGLALLVLAQALGLAGRYFGPGDDLLALALVDNLPLALLLLHVAPRRSNLLPLAWALPLLQAAAWLLGRLTWYEGLALQ